MEELRRQDARKALERECRTLRRQFATLEKEHRVLRAGHEFQCQRLDSMVVQSGALLTLINGLDHGGGLARVETDDSLARKRLEAENRTLVDDRALLLRRNAELELQIDTVMKQFGSLLSDYEDVRGKFKEFKGVVANASSLEELGGWEEL
jgi:hypothetical protein